MTNPVSGGFQFTPTQGLNDTVTYPTTPVSETAARQQVMDLYWQLMNEMNLPTLSAAAYAQYNKLINGNFDVWQRGTSFTNPSSSIYTSDRFFVGIGLDGGTPPTNLIHSKQTLTTGDIFGSYNFYRTSPDGAGSSFGVNSFYNVNQRIEYGVRNLCGNGKKITVSFWVRSSISGKRIGVSLSQRYGSGGSPTSDEVLNGTILSLTSNWQKFTTTFTTNTLVGKTFGSNNDDNLQLRLHLQWGTATALTYFGGGTAESFVGSGNIDIAQVQINAGDQALPFQPRSFAEELALCQRYYEKSYDYANTPASNTDNGAIEYQANSTGSLNYSISYKVRKRTTPTVIIYSKAGTAGKVTNTTDITEVAIGGTVSGETGLIIFGTGVANKIFEFHYTSDAEL